MFLLVVHTFDPIPDHPAIGKGLIMRKKMVSHYLLALDDCEC